MAKTDYKSIDEYIAAHDADEQKVLQKMRETMMSKFRAKENLDNTQAKKKATKKKSVTR